MTSPDPITRLNAALEGRYRIESELGEGGMANVYLADDLKHERKVALKVLKPELAAVVGAERFLAEIKTTANLQHPHILPLHDSGAADGFLFYVMPYIQGETLRDRLERDKQLPVDEAVRLAVDVAEALHAAHQQGVIHRDVKPANILLSGGRPLVADFGIALAVSAAGGGRLTETGLSMGTPYYMSPEQASADRDPSPASDVYSVGCVLYEMLVGEPPYTGGSAQAVLAKILTEDARAATRIRPSIPANVDGAIRRALEKLPADRFPTADAFATALTDPGFRYGDAVANSGGGAVGPWKPLALGFAVLSVLASAVAGWVLFQPEPTLPIQRFALGLDIQTGSGQDPDLTPDGAAVVFVAASPSGGGQQQLWIRRWDNLAPAPIAGTEGSLVGGPVVSPDGAEIAFYADGEIRMVPITGGLVRTLVPGQSCCMRFGSDGNIYAPTEDYRAIQRISSLGGGGESVIGVAEDAPDEQLGYFQLLPGGDAAVYTVWESAGARIEAVRLEEGAKPKVLAPGIKPYLTPTGQLLFTSDDGQIFAAPFDAEALEFTAPAVPLVQGVFVTDGVPYYTFSTSGTLVYQSGGAAGFEFVWVSRSGQALPIDPGHTFLPQTNFGLSLSPDESRIAFNSVVDGVSDIRIKFLPDGPEERITFTEDLSSRPFWTPDGRDVTYFEGPDDTDRNVWSRRADGTGEPELVLDADRTLAQGAWSPDGSWLVLRAGATEGMGVGLRDVLGFQPGSESGTQPMVATPEFVEGAPSVSPDGRWLTYTSTGTGRVEVYVRSFPNVDSTRVRVSTNGGMAPVWSKAGRELFFVDDERQMIAAAFDSDTGRVLSQEALFTIPTANAFAVDGNSFFDVSRDGQRFLMIRPFTGTREAASADLMLVQNFSEVLRPLAGN
jgi:serine/threonine-protein kinase